MGRTHPAAGTVGEQDRQALSHHDGAGLPHFGAQAGIGQRRVRPRLPPLQLGNGHAVHLLHEHRGGMNGLGQALAVGRHGLWHVAHVIAEIEAVKRRQRHAARAGGEDGPHMGRRRPLRHQPFGAKHQGVKSGQFDGWACWKAGSFMQASWTAIVRGRFS